MNDPSSPAVRFALPLVLAIAGVVGGLALFARSLPSPATQRTVPVCGAAAHSRLGECPESTATILANLAPPTTTTAASRPAASGGAVTPTITPTVPADDGDLTDTADSDSTESGPDDGETTETVSRQ